MMWFNLNNTIHTDLKCPHDVNYLIYWHNWLYYQNKDKSNYVLIGVNGAFKWNVVMPL